MTLLPESDSEHFLTVAEAAEIVGGSSPRPQSRTDQIKGVLTE